MKKVIALVLCLSACAPQAPAVPQGQIPIASRSAEGVWTWNDKKEMAAACAEALAVRDAIAKKVKK